MLLKAGFELDVPSILRLKDLRIFSIWVDYPDLDFLDNIMDPEVIHKQQKLYSTLKEGFNESKEFTLGNLDYSEYILQMTALFARLLSHNKTALYINDLQGESQDIFLHGITVASLAMIVGLRLETYLVHERPRIPTHQASDLTYLGVGCMLHDIGKLKLPEELRKFQLTAHDKGAPEWQAHTEIGLDMIRGGLPRIAAQVVINHHQHFDGSGFPPRHSEVEGIDPKPLSGKDIHIFCRIATIADRFESFRHLPDGGIAPNVVALKRMQREGYRKWFDPEVFSAFLQTVPAFTPGDQVVLNDGQVVVVTEVNASAPCRPIVRPIQLELAYKKPEKPADSGPKSEEKPAIEDINLNLHPELHIAKVGELDVTPYLF